MNETMTSVLNSEFAQTKYKKHKLPKSLKKKLFQLESLLFPAINNAMQSNSSDARDFLSSTAVVLVAYQNFISAKKYKLVKDRYWCRVNDFFFANKESSLTKNEDEAIAHMNLFTPGDYIKVDGVWMLSFAEDQIQTILDGGK